MKRQKSVPEDLKKVDEDRGSPTEVDLRKPFEEEVCAFLFYFWIIGLKNMRRI